MAQEFFNFEISPKNDNREYILSKSNLDAYSFINKWPNWPLNILLLYGPKSCGKTHLAKIWQEKANASFLSAEQIYKNQYDLKKNYIIDTIEKIHDETALLHLFNSVKEQAAGYLLMTSGNNPNNIIRLPDLRSRLNLVAVARIGDPDDDILRQMFVKQFTERQIIVEIDVINYLITRIERSFESLYDIVDRLDKKALEEKKNITIPLARKILEKPN
jgi:chromosomal replication initiation ATPase DnaA